MVRNFFIANPIYDIPKLTLFRNKWHLLPDNLLREIISVEEQYLCFSIFLYKNIRHSS